MDITTVKNGETLRIIHCGPRSSNFGWGFRAGDTVEVYSNCDFTDQPANTVAVRGGNGMIGFFEPDALMRDPQVGDRVRTHDFNNVGESRGPGRRPCYYEGTLLGIDAGFYHFSIDKRVWDGEHDRSCVGGDGHAPVNGTISTMGSRVIYRVEKI